MERFCAKVLPEIELTEIARHVVACQPCEQEFTEELRRQRPSDGVGFTLALEFWFQHDHLDLDQLVSLADNQLEETQREIVDVHLKVCGTCREDVHSFLAFREKTAQEMDVSYASIRRAPTVEVAGRVGWWQAPPWRLAYAAGVLVLVTLRIIAVAMILKKRPEPVEVKKTGRRRCMSYRVRLRRITSTQLSSLHLHDQNRQNLRAQLRVQTLQIPPTRWRLSMMVQMAGIR